MDKVRLNKYLASSGVASRRKADELITEGKIQVNGKTASLGQTINPETDNIIVSGRKIKSPERLVYLMLNKPAGIISTVQDEQGRKSVINLVKTDVRVYPVGRLDENSTGLILLTNDGELAYRLTHPKFETAKTYQVSIQGTVSETILEKLRTGIFLKEGKTAPANVTLLREGDNRSLIQMVIHQGWYHQIKRMWARVGFEILSLKRVSIGPIQLGSLPEGQSRPLTTEEVEQLQTYSSRES